MRKLMWFTIGFAVACVMGAYLVFGSWLWLLCGVSFLCAIGLLFVKINWTRILSVALIGCALGSVWINLYDSLYVKNARTYDGKELKSSIVASQHSEATKNGIYVQGEIQLDGKTYKVITYLYDTDSVAAGDEIYGTFKLLYTGANGEKLSYNAGKGIFLKANFKKDVKIIKHNSDSVSYFAADLRNGIYKLLDKTFPKDTVAFAHALLLGDSSLLTYEEDTAFKVSGVRHIIAVSGLHISILFSLVYLLSGKKRITTALIGIPALVVFAAVAGFTPSVMRASIMQILMILALLFNREYDPPTALSFAVLVMLAGNPLVITAIGFQLSVVCIIGIFLFSKPIHRYLSHPKRLGSGKGDDIKAKLTRWFVGSVSVSLSATVLVTPLCAVYFGMVSIVGVLTNLITLWVVSPVFYGIMAACMFGAIWLPMGKWIGAVISWPIRYIQVVARWLSKLPFAAVYTCSIYIIVWLIFAYVLFAVFLLIKKKKPAMLAGFVVGGLILSLLAAWTEPRLDNYRITFLDVGQGQCILLQAEGKNYMVDCGGSHNEAVADIAAEELLSQGVFSLDGLILTHFDDDHAGAADMLMSRISVKKLYLPLCIDTAEIKSVLQRKYTNKIVWVSHQDTITYRKMHIRLYPGGIDATGNKSSMSILWSYENYDILITGDMDRKGELALLSKAQLPKLEYLVAGHHGSKNSTSFELLSETMPDKVIISVGEDNPYGHPSGQVIQRLTQFGCEIWRTDLEGKIQFRG